MTATLTANKFSYSALTDTDLKTRFIVLKNKQLKPISKNEALEVFYKISAIKRELIERGIEPKSLV